MKLTPFHERTAALNHQRRWFNWDRHILPDVHVDAHEELRATRQAVSMGDMSPLSRHVLRGSDAASVLDRVVTRDVTGLEVGQVVYTPWTRSTSPGSRRGWLIVGADYTGGRPRDQRGRRRSAGSWASATWRGTWSRPAVRSRPAGR